MSDSFFFPPTDQKQPLPVDSPQSFKEAMIRAFGCLPPWRLGQDAIPILRGMAAIDRQKAAPYERLSHKIAENGEIEVWAES